MTSNQNSPVKNKLSLGQLLRTYREKGDFRLSQKKLAEMIGVSSKSIRDWEAEVSRPTSYNLKKLLEAFLDLGLFSPGREKREAAELWSVREQEDFLNGFPPFDEDWFVRHLPNKGQKPNPKSSLPSNQKSSSQVSQSPVNNLPLPISKFIGREKEIAQISELITNHHRLVTLTGVGGVGKTRLALELAHRLPPHFGEAVWWVELASVDNPALLPQTIQQALKLEGLPGLPPLEMLVLYLKNHRLLVILDNCGHLVEECSEVVAHLLKSCPGLQVVVTSREKLKVEGEFSFPVPTLSLPQEGEKVGREEVAEFEALALFLDRAKAANPNFELKVGEVEALVQICRRLDGIPLALELAAARTSFLSLSQIETRLADRFRLLTGGNRNAPPRHQTLKAMVEWSYNLLAENEKSLLRQVSIFAGSWSLEGASAVCRGPGLEDEYGVLDGLASLADKSLVRVNKLPEGEARYSLLETIREFGRGKLREMGEEQALRECHLAYYTGLVEGGDQKLFSKEQAQILLLMDRELDNLRAALEFAFTFQKFEPVARLLIPLGNCFNFRHYDSEGSEYMARALALPWTDPLSRSQVLLFKTELDYQQAYNQAKIDNVKPYEEEIRELSQDSQDRLVRFFSLHAWGIYLERLIDSLNPVEARPLMEEARQHLEEAVRLGKDLPSSLSFWYLPVRCNLAFLLYRWLKDYDEARRLFLEFKAELKGSSDIIGLSFVEENLGHIAYLQKDYPVARQYYKRYLVLSQTANYLHGHFFSLISLTRVDLMESKLSQAYHNLEQALLVIQGNPYLRYYHHADRPFAVLVGKLMLQRPTPDLAALFTRTYGLSLANNPPIYEYYWPEELHQLIVETARQILGEERYNTCLAEGQATSPEEANRFVREQLALLEGL